MKKLIIEGQKELSGTIKISGAKNSVVALIPASVLTKGKCIIKNVPKEEESTEETFKSYTYEEEKPFEITKEGGIWVVKGKKVEELFQMTRFTEEESVLRFARILKKMGVEDKLESLGAQRGDEVKIMDYIFNFKE